MTSEQLKWTDKQWAVHLGCTVQSVPNVRKFITEKYFVGVGTLRDRAKYSCALYRMDLSPSGHPRFFHVQSTNMNFKTADDATKYANETFIPQLELLPNVAKYLKVPQRALQMLHIHEKQK